jgi:hypothetical protein
VEKRDGVITIHDQYMGEVPTNDKILQRLALAMQNEAAEMSVIHLVL